MAEFTDSPKPKGRQYRLAALFVVTTLLAVPVALTTNEARNFHRDKKVAQKLSNELARELDAPLGRQELDPYGILELHTSSVSWKKTPLGRLTRIPLFKRIDSVNLHSKECSGVIPKCVLDLDALQLLVLRGNFAKSSVEKYKLMRPKVEILQVQGL